LAKLILNGATSGSVTLESPAVSGTTTLTLPTTSGTVITTGSTFAGTGPAFSAYQSTASISVTTAVWTKVTLNVEDFDTANCFDSTTNYRFTPNVAGYYIVGGCIRVTSATLTNSRVAVYKNGTAYRRIFDTATNTSQPAGSCLVYMNGTTDYVELYGLVTGTTLVFANEGGADITPSFYGSLIRSA